MNKKLKCLLGSLLLDGIGVASYSIPILGETSDFIWAPISALIMVKMYKGISGQAAAAVSFFEEMLPGTDFFPTFTLMWLYQNVLKKWFSLPLKT